MEQNTQRISLVNVAVLLAIGLAGAGVALYSHTLAGYVATVFLGLGFIVAAVSYFQTRLGAREAAERLEFEELARSTKASALFNPADAEVFPARRAREQFERFLVPAFTVLLFLLQGTAAYFLGKSLFQIKEPAILRQPLVAVALFGLFALVLFLLGKYSAAIARLEGNRLLRPASGYLLLGAYLCFGAAAAVAAVGAGSPRVDLYVARGLAILLGLIALETALNLLLEIYRPRVRGQDARLVYESRLVGLLGQPEGLITTAAQALDYQFGFKVSETWFYRFLERALGWLILAQLALLLVSTSIVFVEPGEQALLERWGNPVAGREVLEPGLHLKWPWPMDRAFHHRTDQVQSFNVGFVADPKQEHAEKTILWTVPHYKEEFNLLVASREQPVATNLLEREPAVPVNLLTVSIPVQYQIKDLRAWAYTHTDAPRLLEHIATREVVRYLVSVDVFDIMSRGRPAAAAALRERIQATANALGLGVEILFVGLQDVHPPVKVAPEYEKVVGALQEKEARIQQAEAYRARQVPLARGEAQRKRHEAEAYRTNRLASQAAIITQFTNQLQAYRQSPAVFMNLAYLNALQTISTSRLYVLTITNVRDVINIDLHERVTPDMIEDVQVPR